MMDREARRKFIRKVVKFWFKHNLAIAIGLAVIFIGTTITVLCVCLSGNDTYVDDALTPVKDTTVDDYKGVFDDSVEAENTVRKDRTKPAAVTTESGETVEEYEYSTVLKYNGSTRNGYMNNCIFLGDSRTVAMVSYGFVSDENVLAKVGISHTSVMTYTFQQNSGKEYTVSSYLSSHKAPVIYLGFGVNGMTGISEEKYEKTYKDMVEGIMKLAPDSEIVIMAIWPVDDDGPYKKNCQNSVINKYNAFLKTLAEYEGIYYLDVDTILKGSNGQIKPEYDAGDGLHYKSCAYTQILEYIIHHPVPGVSDEGEFKVKYVAPSGEFKSMKKDNEALPNNVEVVDQLPATEAVPTVTIVPEYVPTPTPTPAPKPAEQKPTQPPAQQPEDKPTLSPSPTPTPIPTAAPPSGGGAVQPSPAVDKPTDPPAPETPTDPPAPETPTDPPSGGDDSGGGNSGGGDNPGGGDTPGGDETPEPPAAPDGE